MCAFHAHMILLVIGDCNANTCYLNDDGAVMRQITEKRTCDLCGKLKTFTYTHIGVDEKMPESDSVVVFRDDEIYELRPNWHACGKCLTAIESEAKRRLTATKKVLP